MPNIKLTQAEVNKTPATGKRYKLRDTEIQGLILAVCAAGGKTYAVDHYGKDGRRTEKRSGEERAKRTKGQTLGEYWVLDNRKSGEPTVQILRRSFKCFWNVEIAKLTQMDLKKWQIERAKENKEASVNRVMTAVRAALNRGAKRGILKENQLSHMGRLKETTSPWSRIDITGIIPISLSCYPMLPNMIHTAKSTVSFRDNTLY